MSAAQGRNRGSESALGHFLGWRMLAICGLVCFAAGYGQTYSVSAFVDPVLDDLGISRGLLSTAYAIGTAIGGLVVLLVGRHLDRRGSRGVMMIAAIGLSAGMLVLSVAAAPWVLFLGFPMIRTFGQGLMPLSARVVIPNWFYRDRARAFSILGLALTLSVAVVPLLNIWLIDLLGWRMAWRVCAVGLALLVVPIVYRFLRDRPEDVGQLPDGATQEPGAAARTDAGIGLSLREARRTMAFWAFVTAGLVPPLVTTGLHLHQATIFADRGTPHAIAAATFTIEAIAMLGANIAVGWLNDRFAPRMLLVVGLSALGGTLLALLFSGNPAIAVAYGALRGASNGLTGVAIDVAWPTYYGRRHLGSIRGFSMAASLFGSAIGPLPFGFAVSLFGGYSPAILGLMVLPLLVAVWILLVPPPALLPRPEPVSIAMLGD